MGVGAAVGYVLDHLVVAKCMPSFPRSKFEVNENYSEFSKQAGWERRSNMAPAELSKRAHMKQLAKSVSTETFQYEMWSVVEDLLFELCAASDLFVEEMSYSESWLGNDRVESCPMDTSPGWFFSDYGKKKKDIFMKPVVHEILNRDWEALNTLNPMVWPLKASLKDELRDIARVSEFKTRVFQAGPTPYTIAGRRLFGEWAAKFYAAGKKLGFWSAAGMNPFSGGWHEFLKEMAAQWWPDVKWSDLDVVAWDKLYPFLFAYFDAVLFMKLAPSNMHLRIFNQIMRSTKTPVVIQTTGEIYLNKNSLDSGNNITLPRNGLGQVRVYLHAYVRKYPSESWNVIDFTHWMRMCTMGDDTIRRMTPGCLVTVEAVIEQYAQMGWVAEPSGGKFLKDIHEVSFCGRTSVWVGMAKQWWPILPLDRVLAIVEFANKKADLRERLERINAALIYAFPFLWQEPSVFRHLWLYVADEFRRNREMRGPDVGRWTLSRLYALYSGQNMSEFVLQPLLA